MSIQPYTFSGAYRDAYCIPDMAMDPRHVFIVHEVLAGWPFKSALELGSFCGASSTAFIEAINRGSQMLATFCDIFPSESLWNVARNATAPGRVRITKSPSVEVLNWTEDFDFILVDACHDLESVKAELAKLIPRRPLCVMAHDTNATDAGWPKAEGARLLRQTFQAMPEYQCIEDAKYREDEQTHRGLFLATSDQRLFDLANGVFEKWSE